MTSRDDEQTPARRPPHPEGVEDTIGPGISEPEKATGLHTSTDHADRVGPSEGQRGPHVEETGYAQHSEYDGSGREIIVTTTTDKEGRVAQGAGRTTEEALKDAEEAG
jgi:hypothetical protein